MEEIRDTSSPSHPALVKQDGSGYWHIFKPTGGHVASFCFERDAANLAEDLFDYVRYQAYSG